MICENCDIYRGCVKRDCGADHIISDEYGHRCRADENSCVEGKNCPDYIETCDCEQCWGGE